MVRFNSLGAGSGTGAVATYTTTAPTIPELGRLWIDPNGSGFNGSPVGNVASLRALGSAESLVNGEMRLVQGYYAVGDGGGGLVYYDSSDTTTADNGSTVFVDAASRRWKRLEPRTLLVEQCGITTGSTAVTNSNRIESVAVSNPAAHLIWSRGDYPIDNNRNIPVGSSPGGLILSNLTGGWTFENESRFVFTTNTLGGIQFIDSVNFNLTNFSSIYSVTPTARNTARGAPGPCMFWSGDGVRIENYKVFGSPGIGLMIENQTRPILYNADIQDTWADGCQFRSCADPDVYNFYSDLTGDDGLAFLSSTLHDDGKGGRAIGITCKRSQTSGINVWGWDTLEISNFEVDSTNNWGVGVWHNATYNTRVPKDIHIHHGVIRNTGQYQRTGGFTYAANGSSGHGLRVYSMPGGTPRDANVRLENIEVFNARESGLYAEANTGTLKLKNVSSTGGATPQASTNANINGTILVSYPVAYFSETEVVETPGTGIDCYNFGDLTMRNVATRNVSKTNTARRAIQLAQYTSGGKTARVEGSGISIRDNQGTPTGFQVGTYVESTHSITGDLSTIKLNSNNTLPFALWANTSNVTALRILYQGTTRTTEGP